MTTYYVSTTGSDAAAGTSTATAFLTISKGITTVVAGDTCRVLPGNYQGSIYINRTTCADGTLVDPITLISDTKYGAKIMPLAATGAGSGNHAALECRANWWVIDGFEVDGSAGYTGAGTTWTIGGTDWWIGIYMSGHGITVQNCHVHDVARTTSAVANGGAGIENDYFYDSAGPSTIRYNWVHHIGPTVGNNTVQGIYIAGRNATVNGNLVYRAASDNIQCWHGATSVTIANNTCFGAINGSCILVGAGDSGLEVGGIAGSRIFNNICRDAPYGIIENGTIGTDNLYSHNNVYNCTTAWALTPASTHTSDVAGDPKHINFLVDGGGDYNLSVGSVCINAGLSVLGGVAAPSLDISGVSRPSGSIWDLGAFEFVAAPEAGANSFAFGGKFRRIIR